MKNTINQIKIQELKELDDEGEVLKELIELFLPSTERKLAKLDEMKSRPLPEEVKPIAHDMRSSCANLGADVLSELATQLEYLPVDDSYPQTVAEIVVKMHAEFVKVREILVTLQ